MYDEDNGSSENTQEEQTFGEVVNCNQLNIRSKPNKDSEIVCVVDVGSLLEINGASNGWARVYTEQGIKGYAMKEYIKEV
jgi:uncharacterized protein YgiM (DUF1202 family)